MVAEGCSILVALLVRDEEAARPPIDVREVLARLADDRRIDNRHQLLDVLVHAAGRTAFRCGPAARSGRCSARAVSPSAESSDRRAELLMDRQTAGGRRPSRPSASRSAGQNAVPLLMSGSPSSDSPRMSTAMYSSPVRLSCLIDHCMSPRPIPPPVHLVAHRS